MSQQTKPLLSIGIIFRNDIRSIERCLKALEPLRRAISCQLVMADTGSEDGSRKIAEQYADILIDFPWIDDFSAARNAVLEHCIGRWYLTVDTDEYLREDISQLTQFLTSSRAKTEQLCGIIIRNHDSYEMDTTYNDFLALRLVRRTPKLHYQGAIHEQMVFEAKEIHAYPLNQTILDHDGYVYTDPQASAAKQERNLKLIHSRLEEEPNNLLLHLQLIESDWGKSDNLENIRRAVELVLQKMPHWDELGAPILRYAIYAAVEHKLPELEEWLSIIREWFPDSMYTRLDISYACFIYSWGEERFIDCVDYGERYLKAISDYKAGKDPGAQLVSTLKKAHPIAEQEIRILLALAYLKIDRSELCVKLLETVEYSVLDEKRTEDLLKVMQELQLKTMLDTTALITAAWDGISAENPSKKWAERRKKVFFQTASVCFLPQTRRDDKAEPEFCRHRYSVYLPLQGRCDVGLSAVILELRDPIEIRKALAEITDWNMLSICALAHALECGAQFPLPEHPLKVEEMDSLAVRLMQDKENLPLSVRLVNNSKGNDWQQFAWNRGLMIAAARMFDWSGEESEAGIELAKIFAKTEERFLPLCYSAEVLQEDKLFLLPPMHRFGWYCVQAFEALDGGDQVGYVRCLREGLSTCEGMKDMVEFLIKHTPEIQAPAPSRELQELADKVRGMLAAFDPEDPAVAAIKASPVYQKVAYLIEGIEAPVMGGLAQ